MSLLRFNSLWGAITAIYRYDYINFRFHWGNNEYLTAGTNEPILAAEINFSKANPMILFHVSIKLERYKTHTPRHFDDIAQLHVTILAIFINFT